MDFFEAKQRVRARYNLQREISKAHTAPIGESGFVTEIAGRVILTAPAKTFTLASELPRELSSAWQEKASNSNEHYVWLQGRYVEAERANRNGAMWSTADLQFGQPSVPNGPLNWLHNETQVIGTVVDARLVQPGEAAADDASRDTAGITDSRDRPYLATISAAWKWVHPDKVAAMQHFNDSGKLWQSMECIGTHIKCASDDTHTGCGTEFSYIQAMGHPDSVCDCIKSRQGARQVVNPTFMGSGIIVPPAAPGWGDANVEVMKQAAALAESAYSAGSGMADSEWVDLVAQVLVSAVR